MNYETFLEDLQAVRDRAGRFRQRVDKEPVETLLTGALQELDVALEELRVTEEETRVQHEALNDGRGSVEAERERFQYLFRMAPVAYLVTDRFGAVREANLRATELLEIESQFLTGKPLASFIGGEDRSRFRDRLGRPERLEVSERRDRPGDDLGGRRSGRRGRFGSSGGCCASCRAQAPATARSARHLHRQGRNPRLTTWPERCTRWWRRRRSCWRPTAPG
jgi:PAS domain-containing protein